MIFLMGRLGLRRMEVHALSWGDLRGLGERSVLSVHGKGDKHAELHVPADVLDVLEAWRAAIAHAAGTVPTPSTPMFLVLGGGQTFEGLRLLPLALMTVGLIVRSRMIVAGQDGPRYGAHALRATAATIAHEHGAGLLTIARLLRHANTRTTQRYIRTAENRRSSAAEVWQGPTFGEAS